MVFEGPAGIHHVALRLENTPAAHARSLVVSTDPQRPSLVLITLDIDGVIDLLIYIITYQAIFV